MQQPSLHQQPYYQEEELSLKDILLKAKEFWGEIWRNKGWILLLGIVLASIFYLRTKEQPTTYTAGLTFMLGQTGLSENPNSELSAFLANFNRRGKKGSNKLVKLARSGRIIYQVLFNRIIVGEKEDYLANHLIDLYQFRAQWAQEPIRKGYENLNLKNFYFSNDRISDFNTKEYRALNILRETISGNDLTSKKGIMSISYDDLGEVYKLEVVTEKENISLTMVETIYKELTDFYIEETVGRPSRNLTKLVAKTDSLLNLVNNAESGLIQATAQRRGIISPTSGLTVSKLNRKVQQLNGLYTQAYDQQQKLEFLLNSQTPTFQVIDQTFIPIKDAPSKLIALLLGGFLGGFLGITFFIIRKLIRDALAA